MLGFVIRRVLWTIPVVIVATALTFLLVKAMPYEKDVFASNPKYTDSQVQALREIYRLDDPLYVQYGHFVLDLVRLDLGVSMKPGALPIGEIISQKLPVTMTLGVAAFAFSALLGIFLGVISALRSNGPLDYTITVVSTLAFALPSFVVATLWVKYSPNYGWDDWGERIGPIVVLGLSIMPYFVRLIRASMLEALQQDYVLTARAKGLRWRKTIARHVLRNSLIPTVTNAGPLFGFILTGSFIIERIMVVPGIASEFIAAFAQPIDTPLILATTTLLALIIIFLNLVVDVIVGWLDPRISHD